MKNRAKPFDEKYSSAELVWGKKSSAICNEIPKHLSSDIKTALEIGGGYGRDAKWLASEKRIKVTVMDISSVAIKQGKTFVKQIMPKVIFKKCDLLDRKDVTKHYKIKYDMIYSYMVLHLFECSEGNEELEKLIKNIKPFLKPTGIMVHMFISRKDPIRDNGHFKIHKHSKRCIINVIEKCGFTSVDLENQKVWEKHGKGKHQHKILRLVASTIK